MTAYAIDILQNPMTGRSVWTGGEMEANRDWIVNLTDAQLANLDQALHAAKATGKPTFAVRKEDFPLPSFERLIEHIQDEVEDGRGFVVLRGLPVEQYSKQEAELIFWGLGTHLGAAVSQNGRGQLISHVTDKGLQFGNKEVRGYQTQSDLFFHNDHGDMVGLLCLRAAKSGGSSKLVSSAAVYNKILADHPEYIDELCRGYHYHMRGEHQKGSPEVTGHRVPVFSFHEGRLSSRIARNAIVIGQEHVGQPLSPRELAPIDYIDRITEELCMNMLFKPGDMQFVSNYTVLHARTGFEDFDEPDKKRHLLRLWLNLPNSRPLTYEFATRYGPGSARKGVPSVR